MKGIRSSDNCYMWSPAKASLNQPCLISNEETKLWHYKLGHLTLRSMQNIIYEKAILGIPELKIEEGNFFC